MNKTVLHKPFEINSIFSGWLNFTISNKSGSKFVTHSLSYLDWAKSNLDFVFNLELNGSRKYSRFDLEGSELIIKAWRHVINSLDTITLEIVLNDEIECLFYFSYKNFIQSYVRQMKKWEKQYRESFMYENFDSYDEDTNECWETENWEEICRRV